MSAASARREASGEISLEEPAIADECVRVPVSVSAWRYCVPLSISTRENSILLPPLPRMPSFSRSIHVCCRRVSSLRATELSAGTRTPSSAMSAASARREASGEVSLEEPAIADEGVRVPGEGTALTVNGPVTRCVLLFTNGWVEWARVLSPYLRAGY